MTKLSLDSVKTLILRCYRDTSPRDLHGLRKLPNGYVTADRKWIYTIRHGGFIERESLGPATNLYVLGSRPVPGDSTIPFPMNGPKP